MVSATSLAAQSAPVPRDFARTLDAFVAQGVRDWGIPGLAITVVRGDSVLFTRGYGVRATGDTARVDTRTLFGIMSTTKAMTAASLAMLVDEGKVQWDDPVTRHLPWFRLSEPLRTDDLRVRDLLTHSAGLPNADILWVRGDVASDEILRRVRGVPAAYRPGRGFIYQNVMYHAAGAVIEAASGLRYGEFLRTRLFMPLGMTRTYASHADAAAADAQNISRAHDVVQGALRVIPEEAVDAAPAAGSVWSTAEDLARWTRFLLDSARVDGRRLISDSAFRELFTPQVIVPAGEFYPTRRLTTPMWTTYSFGWFQQDYDGLRVSMHTGSLPGRVALVGLVPDERIGVFVVGNRDHAEFRHAVMFRVFDLLTGRPARDWSREFRTLYAASDSARAAREAALLAQRDTSMRPSVPLAAFAGTYAHPLWGDVVVRVERDTLRYAAGVGPYNTGVLLHWRGDTFREVNSVGMPGTPWVFQRGLDGRPVRASAGGSEQMVFTRRETSAPPR